MDNQVANACKKTAIVLGFICLLGSIFVAYQASGIYDYGIHRDGTNALLFITTFFTYAFITFIACLLIYAAGEVIQLLHDNKEHLCRIESSLKKEENEMDGNNADKQNVLKYSSESKSKYEKQNVISGVKPPYICGKCNHAGPYEGVCPECGSSIKRHQQ